MWRRDLAKMAIEVLKDRLAYIIKGNPSVKNYITDNRIHTTHSTDLLCHLLENTQEWWGANVSNFNMFLTFALIIQHQFIFFSEFKTKANKKFLHDGENLMLLVSQIVSSVYGSCFKNSTAKSKVFSSTTSSAASQTSLKAITYQFSKLCSHPQFKATFRHFLPNFVYLNLKYWYLKLETSPICTHTNLSHATVLVSSFTVFHSLLRTKPFTPNYSILSLDNYRLHTQLFYFTIRLLWSSTCFEHYMLIIRRLNCIDVASDIVTLSKWTSGAQVERELRSL